MKRIIMFSMFILNMFVSYSQLICLNCVGWFGENTGHPKFNNDSIVVYVTVKNNNKDIGILGFTYKKKLPGYKLEFTVCDTYNHYLNVDSIIFNICSTASKSILQSTIVEDNRFACFNYMDGAIVSLDKVYLIDSLKDYKEDLLIDFTLYLRTKNSEQRRITYSRYRMKYSKANGVYFYL